MGGEKAGSKIKQPRSPSLGGGEEDTEGGSRSEVGEFIRCGHGAEKLCQVFCSFRVLDEELPITDDHRRECYDHPKDAVHQDTEWPGPGRVGHSVITRSGGVIKDKGEGGHNHSRYQVWHFVTISGLRRKYRRVTYSILCTTQAIPVRIV